LLFALNILELKVLNNILGKFIPIILLLGFSYPSISGTDGQVLGKRDFSFAGAGWRCLSPGNYLPDYICDFDFEKPICFDIELIQHIGQGNELKLKANSWRDFSPIRSLERIRSFPLLKPITFLLPVHSEVSNS